jgi:hypothetical protein
LFFSGIKYLDSTPLAFESAGSRSLRGLVGVFSKQANKLVHADVDLTENRPQCAPIQLAMRWHNRLGKRIVPSHDDVASMLAANPETHLLQDRHDLLP